MKKRTRPAADFRVSSVASELDINARHAEAGFDPVPEAVTRRRFYVFVAFLQRHGLTTRTIVGSLAEVGPDTEFRNSDLTDEGFEFTRRFHGRWLNRMGKGVGDAADEAYLERWLRQLRAGAG
jgi:hypothetical protein